ncbi:MAG: T9SS type A sorting domain-containing protein [Flavobacteriales bacterium]|jgi:hypothetical protein
MKISFVLIGFFSSLISFAQQNTLAAGANASSAEGSISYSIGQIDFSNVSSSSGSVNQGVQQPFEFFVSSVLEYGNENSFSIFPNPTNEILNISQSFFSEKIEMRLLDMSGRIVLSDQLNAPQHQIDLRILSQGVYNLTLIKNNQILTSFKVIKY